MTQQIFNDPVVIDSGVDEPQLTIRGSGDAGSEQTAPLQSWQTSDAVDQARITGDGRFQIGTFSGGAMATDDSLIEAHRSETDTGKPKRGIHLLGAITDPLTSIISWIVQELVLKGTSGISALHTALRVRLTNENTGDMTGAELLGGDIEVTNDGGHGSTNGKVPSAVGLRVGLTNQSGGYLQTGVGLQVEMANLGVADTLIGIDVPDVDEGTDNYALRTGAGKVRLGELGLGLVKSNANGLLANVAATTDPDVEMVGATDTEDGATGLVPQPLAGDEEKFLRGDGLWAVPPGSGGGSNFYGADGIAFVDPTVKTWTPFNHGTGTYSIDTTNKRLYISQVGITGLQMRGWHTPAPSAPYEVRMHIKTWLVNSNVTGFIVGWRDGTSQELATMEVMASGSGVITIRFVKWNSPTSSNSTYLSINSISTKPTWVKLQDDNTDRAVYVSEDGVAWSEVHRVARTDFLTPDQILFGIGLPATAVIPQQASLLSYEEL